MTIHYNVTGEARKALVKAISEITGAKAEYMRAPTFSYRIDYFTVDPEGTLTFDNMADSVEVETLLEGLAKRGFEPVSGSPDDDPPEGPQGEQPEDPPEKPEPDTNDAITVTYRWEDVTGQQIANYEKLVAAKGALIQKALGFTALPVQQAEGKVHFPWKAETSGPEEGETDRVYIDRIAAIETFIRHLVELAGKLKWVNATAKEEPNAKYAFRCFLLRLGFIGKDWKDTRKILLSGLSGNAAFKTERRNHEETPET